MRAAAAQGKTGAQGIGRKQPAIQAVFTRSIVDPTAGAKLTGKLGSNAVGVLVAQDERNSILLPGSQFSRSAELDGGAVRFRVRDHGPGIPADQIDTIFRPFQQLDMTLTRGVAGLGLGLAICKGIVEEHGGGISVEPAEGGGCIFSFTLPLGGAD